MQREFRTFRAKITPPKEVKWEKKSPLFLKIRKKKKRLFQQRANKKRGREHPIEKREAKRKKKRASAREI